MGSKNFSHCPAPSVGFIGWDELPVDGTEDEWRRFYHHDVSADQEEKDHIEADVVLKQCSYTIVKGVVVK
jgi:hypothetical protein